MQFNRKNPLIIIVGPTGVGKTDISLKLAADLEGEIISADSRLFYRGMDIGTAKPSDAERQKIRHHLIDVCEPDEIWSLAIFQQQAYQSIQDVLTRKKFPFLVGGTGQYIRSVAEGWLPPPIEPDERLRSTLNQLVHEMGERELHRKLSILDPVAAETIDSRNVRRTVRALEVIFKTGRRFSDQRRQGDVLFSILTIGLTRPRGILYQRIDDRIDRMLEIGFIDEVRRLLDAGYSRELPSMSAIGYREIASYLEREISLDEAIIQIKRKTRQFVRRQANWFGSDDRKITWFDLENISEDQIKEYVKNIVFQKNEEDS